MISFRGRGEAAERTAQCLAERAGDDVHAPHHAAVFGAACRVQWRRGRPVAVAVVHHDQRAMAVGEIADGFQIRDPCRPC
jgi:hypothetical protein